MAGYVAQNWNTIYPSLLGSYAKLVELGFNPSEPGTK